MTRRGWMAAAALVLGEEVWQLLAWEWRSDRRASGTSRWGMMDVIVSLLRKGG